MTQSSSKNRCTAAVRGAIDEIEMCNLSWSYFVGSCSSTSKTAGFNVGSPIRANFSVLGLLSLNLRRTIYSIWERISSEVRHPKKSPPASHILHWIGHPNMDDTIKTHFFSLVSGGWMDSTHSTRYLLSFFFDAPSSRSCITYTFANSSRPYSAKIFKIPLLLFSDSDAPSSPREYHHQWQPQFGGMSPV